MERPAGDLAWLVRYNFSLTNRKIAEGEENFSAGEKLLCFQNTRPAKAIVCLKQLYL